MTQAKQLPARPGRVNWRTRRLMTGFLFVLPSFILILSFWLLPILMSVYFSFTKYNVLSPAVWLGLDNYVRLFSDPMVLAALKNTLLFTLITVPLQTILALLLAAVLAESFRNRFGNFLRSAMFIPVISSTVIVGTIWVLMFKTDGGIINTLLGAFGIEPVNWLGSKATALLSVCIPSIWKNSGYFMVIFFAGILNINPSLYEAAEVDGASRFQQFRGITVPLLRPIVFMVITLGIIWSFQVFDLVYTMTGGGPGTSTITLVYTIYSTAFKEYNMGYASAISVLLLAVIIIINAVKSLLFRDVED